MTEARITPEVYLDPDGRPIEVIDLEGEPRKLTVWGMVVTADLTAAALILTDHAGEPPTVNQLQELSDALVDDPNDPEPTLGSRAWERRRADRGVHELSAMADRVLHLAERLQETRGDLDRYREMHAAQVATIRQQRQELDAARQSGRDAARLAVIALTRSIKPRRYRRTPR